mgnify:CR=1 FL=1
MPKKFDVKKLTKGTWVCTSVALDKDEARMLAWLMKATGIAKNQVIRRAVRELYSLEQKKVVA